MLMADSAAQYVVPASSVIHGQECSLCKKAIRETGVADSLVLTTMIESQGDTILTHSHISCIQGLVNEVPSVYMEYEDLRNSYLEAV